MLDLSLSMPIISICKPNLKRPNGPTVNLLQYVGQWNHLEVTPNRLHIPWPAKLHMPQTHEFWTRCSSPSTWCWLASSIDHFRNYNSSYTSSATANLQLEVNHGINLCCLCCFSLYRALNLGLFQILENDPLIVHLWWMYNVWSLYQQKIHNGIQFTVLTCINHVFFPYLWLVITNKLATSHYTSGDLLHGLAVAAGLHYEVAFLCNVPRLFFSVDHGGDHLAWPFSLGSSAETTQQRTHA